MLQSFRKIKNLAIFAVSLLLALNLSLAGHGHGADETEKTHHCATCQLLPQGIEGISPAGFAFPHPETTFLSLSFYKSFSIPLMGSHFTAIRGPPSFSISAS